jgi:hypothetical protein
MVLNLGYSVCDTQCQREDSIHGLLGFKKRNIADTELGIFPGDIYKKREAKIQTGLCIPTPNTLAGKEICRWLQTDYHGFKTFPRNKEVFLSQILEPGRYLINPLKTSGSYILYDSQNKRRLFP